MVGPHHGQREQLVQAAAGDSGLHRGESLHVPEEELPPSSPLLVALAVGPERVDPLGQPGVLVQVLRNNVSFAGLTRHAWDDTRRDVTAQKTDARRTSRVCAARREERLAPS